MAPGLLVRRTLTVWAETEKALCPVDEMLPPTNAIESIIVMASIAVCNFFIMPSPFSF